MSTPKHRKPRKRFFGKVTAVAATLALAAGLTVAEAPTPASAHTVALSGVVECNIETEMQVITWTFRQTNTPDGVETDVKIMNYVASEWGAGQDESWVNAWFEHVNGRDVTTKTGNFESTVIQYLPGTATGVQNARMQIDYKSGYNSQYANGSVTLTGDCSDPDPTVITPTLEFTEPTCLAAGSVVKGQSDHYTWTETGPSSARVFTAHAVGNVELTKTTFGPYDLRRLTFASGECQPTLTVEAFCGGYTVTFYNPNNFPLSANFGYGDPTWVRPWSDTVIAEGPYAGLTFGKSFQAPYGGTLRNVQNGSESVTVYLDEDLGGGSVVVTYMVNSGSEQMAYILPQTVTVDTDCVPPVEGVYPNITVVSESCDYENNTIVPGSITVGEGEHVKSAQVYLVTDDGIVKQTDTTPAPYGTYTVIVVFDDDVIATSVDGWKVSPSSPNKASKTFVVEEAECQVDKPVATITDAQCVDGIAGSAEFSVAAGTGVTTTYRINNAGAWLDYTGPVTVQVGDEVDARHYAPDGYLFPNGKDMAWNYNLVVADPDCPLIVVETPPAPEAGAPTCTDPGYLPMLVNGEFYTAMYVPEPSDPAEPGVYTAAYTTIEGRTFESGTSVSYDLEVLAQLEGEKDCPTDKPEKPEEPNLAQTGTDAAGPVSILGAGMLLLGGLALVMRRRAVLNRV